MADKGNDPLAALRAAGLKRQQEAEAAKAAEAARLKSALAGLKAQAPAAAPEPDPVAEALAALRAAAPDPATSAAGPDPVAAALEALRAAAPDPAAPAGGGDAAGAVLAALRAAAPAMAAGQAAGQEAQAAGLAALRAAGEAALASAAQADTRAELEAALAALAAPEAEAEPEAEDDPLAGLDDLLGDEPAAAPAPAPEADDPLAGLDDLLGEAAADATAEAEAAVEAKAEAEEAAPEPEPEAEADDPLAGLDDLLADDAPAAEAEPDDPLAGLLDDAPAAPEVAAPARPAQEPFGRLDAARPDPATLHRPRLRLAVFGDFTGRGGAGRIEVGEALARRRAIRLDVDTIDDVIAGFATILRLPVTAADGTESAIEVPLREIDDLHPDALYENLPMFSELAGLRGQLTNAATSARAVERLKGWGAADGAGLATRRHSAGSDIPADRKLSDFEALIGGAVRPPAPATAQAERLIAGIVGPHVVAAPDPQAGALVAAVDAALTSAMRLVLHHPEFRAIEAQWRSLDFLARRVETGDDIEITLYDVSAEELAADLAAQEDLGGSGLYRLLMEAALPEDQGGGGAGGFSALFGLYTFEETPPHAELLARLARIAAHVDAPFFAALSPACLDTPLRDRHPLTDRAWRALRALPEAGWLGLCLPRFLLRHPYGQRTDPIDAFDFEEFSPQAGLRSLAWANPVVAVAALLAATRTQAKSVAAMELGQVMSLGSMPFHYVTDAHGDQVALPCTERNLTLESLEGATVRGLMALVSPRGRDEVRLASFQSLAGAEVRGAWSSGAAPAPSAAPAKPAGVGLSLEMEMPAPAAAAEGAAAGAAEGAAAEGAAAGGLDDLDALLAGFEDAPVSGDGGGSGDGGDMDAELAALLEGL